MSSARRTSVVWLCGILHAWPKYWSCFIRAKAPLPSSLDRFAAAWSRCRRARPVAHGAAVASVVEPPQPPVPAEGPPYATHDDLRECDGLVMGSPTRFGNMAAPLKFFLDGTSALWVSGALAGKPAGVFTSTQTMHGGQETTLLLDDAAAPPSRHGHRRTSLHRTALSTTRAGGSPYGASHFAGDDTQRAPDRGRAHAGRAARQARRRSSPSSCALERPASAQESALARRLRLGACAATVLLFALDRALDRSSRPRRRDSSPARFSPCRSSIGLPFLLRRAPALLRVDDARSGAVARARRSPKSSPIRRCAAGRRSLRVRRVCRVRAAASRTCALRALHHCLHKRHRKPSLRDERCFVELVEKRAERSHIARQAGATGTARSPPAARNRATARATAGPRAVPASSSGCSVSTRPPFNREARSGKFERQRSRWRGAGHHAAARPARPAPDASGTSARSHPASPATASASSRHTSENWP